MNTSPHSDSLPRIACLAALELENLAASRDSSTQYINSFIEIINSNMKIKEQDSEAISFSEIDPMTGYAVRKALVHSGEDIKIDTLHELASKIYARITKPLEDIAKSKHSDCDMEYLSDMCLRIAQVYSSMQLRQDDFDTHPFR